MRVYLGITILNTSYFVYNIVMLFACRFTGRYLRCLYKGIPRDYYTKYKLFCL